MIGNFITVQQLYDYAVLHNYLNTEASTVLDIINRENKDKNNVVLNYTSINNTNTVDFSNIHLKMLLPY